MDVLAEFIRSRKDLNAKSPKEYEYEIEIRLKDVTEKEFTKLSKINSIAITEDKLYSVKGSNTVTIRQMGSEFFIKERISSKMIYDYDAEIVLSLERKHYREEGLALKTIRHKERHTMMYDKFKIDSTRVISDNHTHYEIELEVLDDDCEFKSLELEMERIRPATVLQLTRLINELVPSLNLCSYKFPKPVDITIRELVRHYSLGGSVSLKFDGTRAFLACYEGNIYTISTTGEETNIKSGVQGFDSITLFDTEAVSNVYYAFDIIILHGVVVSNQPLKERVKMISRACLAVNKAAHQRLVVAKRHFMFKTFSAFATQHEILEKQIQKDKHDGLIYTHSQSYLDPVMRWKPQKTVDLLYQGGALMAYNKKEHVDSKLKMSQDSKKPREDVISEFIVNSDGSVTLLREREDKVHPNSITVVERIKKITRDEKNMFDVFKGLTVSIMRSYHNDVKRTLLMRGTGHLLDVGSGFGGDISKWNHYRNVTCIEPSHTNIEELKRRLGNSRKVKVIQTKIEHLRGFEKSVTTLSCFFCITLIDINKFIKIAQKIFSDKAECVFLCIVMSKKHVIEFFNAREIEKYVCKAYSIKLESDSKIHIHIPGTIVLDQTESLVDVDELIEHFSNIGFKLETRNTLDENKFMSSDECLLSSMYESLVMTRTKQI